MWCDLHIWKQDHWLGSKEIWRMTWIDDETRGGTTKNCIVHPTGEGEITYGGSMSRCGGSSRDSSTRSKENEIESLALNVVARRKELHLTPLRNVTNRLTRPFHNERTHTSTNHVQSRSASDTKNACRSWTKTSTGKAHVAKYSLPGEFLDVAVLRLEINNRQIRRKLGVYSLLPALLGSAKARQTSNTFLLEYMHLFTFYMCVFSATSAHSRLNAAKLWFQIRVVPTKSQSKKCTVFWTKPSASLLDGKLGSLR